MLRFLKIAIPSFVIGVVAGGVGWYLVSPLFFDQVVSERLETDGVQVVSSGAFRDADAVHKGKGAVAVVTLPDGSVEFQFTGFEVTNGPDLEVWLSAHPDPQTSADVKGAAFLSLGQLKGNIGDQAYSLPADATLADWKSITIWCQQFGVLFAPAPLTPS